MFTKPVYINRTEGSFDLSVEKEAVAACRLQEPDYKEWIPNATLRRRMSRMVRMGVATGLQCLGGQTGENAIPVQAILTATGLGCLADTEKFLNTILDNDEQLLTPTAFIQSTFNTIGAQIALLTGNHSYNTTYVHRAFSLESALLDAALLLQEEEAQTVLVGAVDEMTPALQALLERFGRRQKIRPGEGAAFFLLSGSPSADCRAELVAMEMFSGSCSEQEFSQRISTFLRKYGEEEAMVISPEAYKSYCGEYPTAMSFALWYACNRMQEDGFPASVLLCNSYLDNHSFLLVRKA